MGLLLLSQRYLNSKAAKTDLSYSIPDCKARALTAGTGAATFKKLLRSKMNEMFPIRHG